MSERFEAAPGRRAEEMPAAVRDRVKRMRSGSIAIAVHDGAVVQLDITEKRRLAR